MQLVHFTLDHCTDISIQHNQQILLLLLLYIMFYILLAAGKIVMNHFSTDVVN